MFFHDNPKKKLEKLLILFYVINFNSLFDCSKYYATASYNLSGPYPQTNSVEIRYFFLSESNLNIIFADHKQKKIILDLWFL